MRYLLILPIVMTLLVIQTEVSSPPVHANGGIPVYASLFHPTNTLACGWHYNCDGVFTEPNKIGLDYKVCQGCSEITTLRMKMVGGSTGTWLAKGNSSNSSVLGCPFAIRSAIQRIADSAIFGSCGIFTPKRLV